MADSCACRAICNGLDLAYRTANEEYQRRLEDGRAFDGAADHTFLERICAGVRAPLENADFASCLCPESQALRTVQKLLERYEQRNGEVRGTASDRSGADFLNYLELVLHGTQINLR